MQIASSTSSEVCLTGVRPHCLEPVVEVCSAKAAVRELHKSAVTCFLQLWTLHDNAADAESAFNNQKYTK